MKKSFLFCFFIWLSVSTTLAQERPKLGVTLSGGGARGLAHVGFMMAMDEAGIRPDYITGTSAGAIVGALWAAGYSGKEIDKLVTSIDWEEVFSSKIDLRRIPYLYKDDYDRFPLSIAADSSGIQVPTGLVEAQEVWSILSEYLFHTYHIQNFDDLEIPFACVATDLGTGEALIMRSGNLVSAVRASMSIPSVFSAVEREGKQLVDGGVILNFPVSLVREMGADFVIGINVGDYSAATKKNKSFIEILYSLSTYRDTKSFQIEKENTDVFIDVDLEDYQIGSFGDADEIIQLGKDQASKWIKRFEELSDSLNQESRIASKKLVRKKNAIISSIAIRGVSKKDEAGLRRIFAIKRGKSFTPEQIEDAVIDLYATGLYDQVRHTLAPDEEGNAILNLEIVPKPSTKLGLGLNYNSFSEMSILSHVTKRNLGFPGAMLDLKFALSQNPRLNISYDAFLDEQNSWLLRNYINHERFQFPIYQNYVEFQRYRSIYSELGSQIWLVKNKNSIVGLGQAFYEQRFKPRIAPNIQFEARSHGFISSLWFKKNTLDRNAFPLQGAILDVSYRLYYSQTINSSVFEYGENGGLIDQTDERIIPNEYFHSFQFRYEGYSTYNKWTKIIQIQTGQQLNTSAGLFNFFTVGGDYLLINNQIKFTGLTEHNVNTSSVGTALFGLQYDLGNNIYTQFKGNIGFIDMLMKDSLNLNNRISGFSFSAGYLSILGPLNLSLLYNPEANSFASYINIGFNF